MAKLPVQIQKEAVGFAARFDETDEINTILKEEAFRREDSKRLPVQIRFSIVEKFQDVIEEMPVPGSTGDNNPDKYEEKVPNGSGGTRTRKGSFWEDMAKALPVCKAMQSELDAVEKTIAGDVQEKYKGKPKAWLEAERGTLRQRIRAMVQAFIRGAQLCFKELELSEYEGVEIVYRREKDANGVMQIVRTQYPIMLKDTSEEGKQNLNHRFLSVGEFLALNVGRAQEMGGGFDNLLKAKRRDGDGGSRNTVNVASVETLDATIAAIANFLDDKKNQDRLLTYLGNKENDHLVETIGDLYYYFDGIFPKIENRYRRLKGEKANGETETKAA